MGISQSDTYHAIFHHWTDLPDFLRCGQEGLLSSRKSLCVVKSKEAVKQKRKRGWLFWCHCSMDVVGRGEIAGGGWLTCFI